MHHNLYPYQSRWDAQARIAWLEFSGPRYTDMVFKFVRVARDKAVLIFNGDGEEVAYCRTKMSYVSWLICLGAEYGDTVKLKIRCDDVSFEI